MCIKRQVLVPLAEISPDLIVPGAIRTAAELLAEIDQDGIVKL
jgi:7,8-dihydro-6-hydroxymethylpterin-pyrophosphokinase